MNLREFKDLLVEIGLPEKDAIKQSAMLVISVNNRITDKEVEEARLIAKYTVRRYLDAITADLSLSRKLYFEEKFKTLELI